MFMQKCLQNYSMENHLKKKFCMKTKKTNVAVIHE